MQLPTDIPDPVLNPALKVGAVTGVAGMVVGGVGGILRGSQTVGLFSILTGVNCAVLGTSFWATRATMLRALRDPEAPPLRPREKAYVSGASGALAGSFVALLTGKLRSVIPGAIVWGLVGLAGQSAYNIADARHSQSVAENQQRGSTGGPSFWDRTMRSRMSPVTRLTTEEYENLLQKKLLVLEADLALANEEIERLEKMKQDQETAEKDR